MLVAILIIASSCIYASLLPTRKYYYILLIFLMFLLGSEAIKAVHIFELSGDFLSTKNFLELGQIAFSYKYYLSILPLIAGYFPEKSNVLVTIWLLVPLAQILFFSNALLRQESIKLFVCPALLGKILSTAYINLAILFISSGFFLFLPVFNSGYILTGHILFQSVSVSLILIGGLFYWFGNKVVASCCLILAIISHPSSLMYLLISITRPLNGLKVLPFNFTINKISLLKIFALVMLLSVLFFNIGSLFAIYYNFSSPDSSYFLGATNIRFVYLYCLPTAILIFLLENVLVVGVNKNFKSSNSPNSAFNSRGKTNRNYFPLFSYVTYVFTILVFLAIMLDSLNPSVAYRLAAIPCFILLVPTMYIATLYSVQLFVQSYRSLP